MLLPKFFPKNGILLAKVGLFVLSVIIAIHATILGDLLEELRLFQKVKKW
jgi:hypothetical protein